MIDIKINLELEGATIPEYAHDGDSGFDFISLEDFTILARSSHQVNTGISFEVPKGMEIQVRSKSGLGALGIHVINSPGTIDSNFRGTVKILLFNQGSLNYSFKKGHKVAQGVLCPVYQARFQPSTTLSETTRGSGELGSTGL
jgi:dUTP pyrophosphatase